MKTVLVTGCAGFIGSNFCRLFEKDYSIIGVDNFSRGSHRRNISDRIFFREMDITNASSLESLFYEFPEIHGIINFAAETHVDFSLAGDALFWSTNVLGVRNLAQIALKKKIRILQVSTDEVYGPSLQGENFSEEDRLNPRNPYAASKAAADLLLKSYHESYQLDCIITRGTNTIGPRQSLEKAIPKAIVCFLKDKAFPLYRTPAKRLWLSVEDHCSAIMMAFENGKSGLVYNVSPDSENEMETRLMIEKICQLIGRGKILEVEDRPAYDLRYLISSQKIREELGWKPIRMLSVLSQETVCWYRDNQEWIETHPQWSCL